MSRFRPLLHLSLLLSPLLGASAMAQTAPPDPVAISPSTGLWWSPGENGQFLQLDIGPGGYAFATLTDSDVDGAPAYSVLQGQLTYTDAGRPGDGLAVLESTRYQIDNAGCLDCGAGYGQTRAAGPVLALRFLDATHAQLLAETGHLRRYERFPLYTRAVDVSAERYTGRDFLLSSHATGAPPEQVRVRLVETSPNPRCDSPGLAGTGARNLQLTFPDDPQGFSALTRQFATTRLLIGSQINPQLDLKALLTFTRRFCPGPPGFCNSNPGAFQIETRELCLSTYRMQEVDDGLRGAALPNAGADPFVQNPNGAARFTGALSLLPLPDTASATLWPSQGLWWSTGENGHFMQLDIGPGGYALATLTEGGANGLPTYQVMQAQLQPGDASITGGTLATLASPLYRVVGAGCLACGPGDGRTIPTGANASLQFSDGTHAVLAGPNGVIRRYERFPLYTRAMDELGGRVERKRFALSALVAGVQRTEVVRLQPIAADPRCESPGLEQARNYQFSFEHDPSGALAQAFFSARLQIATGPNPALDLKAIVPEILRDCSSRPFGLPCGPTGREFCRSIYRMHEVDADLRGVAPPRSGIVAPESNTVTPARFSGSIALQELPGN